MSERLNEAAKRQNELAEQRRQDQAERAARESKAEPVSRAISRTVRKAGE